MFDLYILESCPYCHKVMDFLEEKEIPYNKFDISENDNKLRLLALGGKEQVPFLFNEDTNEKMYESTDIIKYLERETKE